MRCYAPPAQWSAQEIRLAPEEAHHLVHVMRRRVGESVDVFDGQGQVAGAVIQLVDGKEAILAIRSRATVAPPRTRFHLFQCIVREQKMDFIIQKAVELGVSSLQPLTCRHAVVQLGGKNPESRPARWQRIALNAAKQCGAVFLPAVEPAQPLLEFLEKRPPLDLLLFCSLEKGVRPLAEILPVARENGARQVGVLVGPEGDLDEMEKRAVNEAGFTPAGLGSLVLRAETAAVYVMSVLNYEFRGRANPA